MRTIIVLFALTLCGAASVAAAQTPARAAEVIVYTPDAERFVLALDEIELQWRDERRTENERTRMVAIRDSATPEDITTRARVLEAENPGAVAYLVLYEADQGRSDATRRLLGREVAVLLNDTAKADVVLKALPGLRARAVGFGAYVVEASDPLAALALADTIRGIPGVKTAYPLLQRRHFTR
jgi:predicted secreted protein